MSSRSDITVNLHIGLHKTGSTTLQSFLSHNENTLREAGYLYPVSGRGRIGDSSLMLGHHNLAWQLRKESDQFDVNFGTWENLVAEIESVDLGNVIVSAEDLDTLDRNSIERLAKYLREYHVIVIVYLRRQDLAIQSAYGGGVKRGLYLKDFQSYIEKQISGEPRLRYDRLLAPWRDQFGLRNIMVRPLEEGQIRGDLCRDFMHCAGMDESVIGNLSPVPNRNAAPSLKTLEAARLATRIMRLISAELRQHGKCMKAIMKYAEKNGWNAERLSLINQEDHLRILDEFHQSNAAVAREYLSREDGRLFLDAFGGKGVSEFDVTRFSDREFLEISSIIANHRR